MNKEKTVKRKKKWIKKIAIGESSKQKNLLEKKSISTFAPLSKLSLKPKKTKIRVIGIGGGGGNIVSELSLRLKNTSFVVANTDLQALKNVSRFVTPFQFGESLTRGLGSGMNMEVAKNAAILEKEKIKKIFTGYDFCILISCLGGGVGSGATPVFAKIARSLGVLTLGVFTLPFKFEGKKKEELAKLALQEIRPYLNAFVVLPNDRIFRLVEKNTPLSQSLFLVNKNLSDSLEGLIETIYQPGVINIDFADVRTILQGYGRLAYINCVMGQGENRVQEAIKLALNSPLYPYTIKGAKKVLFNISGGKELAISEVAEVSKLIFEQVFRGAQIIFGISQSSELENKIKISILATGCFAKDIFESLPPFSLKGDNKKTNSEAKKPFKPTSKLKNKEEKRSSKKLQKKKTTATLHQSAVEREEVKKVKVPVLSSKHRKTALEVQKEIADVEKEIIEKEKLWDVPSFLRKQKI